MVNVWRLLPDRAVFVITMDYGDMARMFDYWQREYHWQFVKSKSDTLTAL